MSALRFLRYQWKIMFRPFAESCLAYCTARKSCILGRSGPVQSFSATARSVTPL